MLKRDEDDIIRTPPFLYDMYPNAAPSTQVDIVERDGKLKTRFTVGNMDTAEPLYEPPTSDFDNELLFGMIDGLVDGDYEKASDYATKIYEYELGLVHHTTPRSDLAKGETHVEHNLFVSGVSLAEEAHKSGVEKVVLLNPSKGVIKRVEDHTRLKPEILMLPDVPLNQKREVKEMATARKWTYTEGTKEDLSDDKFYYLGFRGSLGQHYGLKHYMGFDVNPLQLGLRGKMVELRKGVKSHEYYYYRYDKRKVLYYNLDNTQCNVYPVDYLYERYKGLTSYRRSKPIMHDLYSTTQVYKSRLKVTRAIVMPYNCRYLVGDYNHDKKGVFNSEGRYVLECGNRAWATRYKPPELKVGLPGDMMAKASYVVSDYGAAIVFLGKKRFLKGCSATVNAYMNGETMKVPRFLRKRSKETLVKKDDFYYYDVSYRDSTKVVVEQVGGNYSCNGHYYKDVVVATLPSDIAQLVGTHTFCTSTFQTLLGTKVLYVRDDESMPLDNIEFLN